MAATELIHLPLWAQLRPPHALPTQILFEPASLICFSLHRLFGCALDGAECSRRLPVTSRGGLKLALFQQILEPNQLFDRLTAGLHRLESVSFSQRDLIQHARSYVEIPRVY